MEEYWAITAKNLAGLFSCIPGFKLSDLGDDPQKFLAAYVPTSSLWDERAEHLRQYFVRMEPRLFGSST